MPPSLPPELSSLPNLQDHLKIWEAERSQTAQRNRLRSYRPYPKQAEFHAAGADNNETLFMAGNQLGKTWAGGFETAIHATGRYPDWWDGRVFNKPIRGMA